ncbi:threonine synthase [uncultured Ruminococcus sp.]|uniref:threonine synthase n=1 Tax=uncultured Ruminococcus sp. TaxID=165186 RepID=UPI00293040E7|nr:threonine synthase [uncultured Ruminococcus sp.]
MKNVINCRCVKCGREYPAKPDITACECGGILDVIYDYEYIKTKLNKEVLKKRTESTMWRYRELLPIEEETEPAGLRVGMSPLYEAPAVAADLGIGKLYIKDDGVNPTASLKDRASAMAVTKAIEAGYDTIACSSTGNAASSLAGNAAKAGLKTYIFVPARAPKGKIAQLMMFGANLTAVDGSYEETFELSKAAIDKYGWYNRNAAINPYLGEGKKTVAHEICEQLDFIAPDYVAVSVGDGCTVAGVYKGLYDMYMVGLIDKLPRIISVQAEGCCPINTAVMSGEPWQPQEENTYADSIAVGVPRNPDKAINAIKDSDGICVNVSDDEIRAAQRYLAKKTGVFGEPAGVTATAGLLKLSREGRLPKDATIVSIVTGNGLKDIDSAIKSVGEPVHCKNDLSEFESKFGLF